MAECSDPSFFEDPDIVADETRKYLKMNPTEARSKAQKKLDEMENVTLNIAVTGESGVGKSTFVNALRGLRDGEEGAAQTGVTETTMEAVKYVHPSMPNVYIWDLPGIGTPNFKAKKYLKDVQFHTYDFFIIIGGIRFKENDIMLAKEIKKMNKAFYFVRSKIDQDVQSESRKKDFNEDKVLARIRRNCQENLVAFGNPKVFLISTLNLGKYDFQKLVNCLEENLSDHKWSALVQSLPVSSISMLQKKKEVLFKNAMAVAAATATTAGILIPGVSVGCEIGVMKAFFERAQRSFGVDRDSIQLLSQRINKSEGELRLAMKSRFAQGVTADVITHMLKTKGMVAAKTFQVILYGVTLITLGISFGTTLHLLRQGICEIMEDAREVLCVAGF